MLYAFEAEREIAQEPGHFCSQPSELDEKAVIQTIQAPQSIYLAAEHQGEIYVYVISVSSIHH